MKRTQRLRRCPPQTPTTSQARGSWLQDRGPVFYAQSRAGRDGRAFRIRKFRTMVADAEAQGPAWTVERDPRVTPVGRVLRRTALDELPELLSIWKGDMPFVGPRALHVDQQEALEAEIPGFRDRLGVRPRLTGLAQIYDRSDDEAAIRSRLPRADESLAGYAKPARDFGRGFYTTTLRRQAEAWAWQLAAQTPAGPSPAVIAFTVSRDDLASLDSLWFVRGAYDAEDFWSFVFYCRRGPSATHGRPGSHGWYDVVVGPVAAFWQQRAVLQDYDQVSFHTDRGVRLLNASSKRWWSV